MQTSWKDVSVADKFDLYDDSLEQIAGYRKVFELLETENAAKILDYGCGPGKVAYRLAHLGNKQIVAVDESEHMLTIARNKRVHPAIAYSQIEQDDLSFIESSTLDYAIACYVFINTATEARILNIMKEIYRVLKPSGQFLILDTNPDSTGIQFTTFKNGECNKQYHYGEARKEWLNLCDGNYLVLNDYHWPKSMYFSVLNQVGFKEVSVYEPTLKDIHKEELKKFENQNKILFQQNDFDFPPFVIFRAIKP
jgi:ubiquinone/menaquinone biosynthesis C-methylase UbiE